MCRIYKAFKTMSQVYVHVCVGLPGGPVASVLLLRAPAVSLGAKREPGRGIPYTYGARALS